MKNKNILILSLLVTPFLSKADSCCIGITTVNPVTFVSEQHPLRFVNCPCNCSNSSHLEDSTCITCNHKSASSNVIQTAKTNGNFVSFMPPTQATTSCPTCPSADWVETLVGYVEEKKYVKGKKATATQTPKKYFRITGIPYAESTKKPAPELKNKQGYADL
jgi:hypothetical protein